MLFRICIIFTFKSKSIYITSEKNIDIQLQNHFVIGAVNVLLSNSSVF